MQCKIGKYDIQTNIPFININHENAININKEISSVFYNKENNIIEKSKEEDAEKSIYTISYTAYLNENILSIAIRATLKEGKNAQRIIIKTYTYNLSTNEIIDLKSMLEIKGINREYVEEKIQNEIRDKIRYFENLASLGYEIFKRDIKNDMYKVDNTENYLLGPDGSIYIIYAYGNRNFTSENDIVYVK